MTGTKKVPAEIKATVNKIKKILPVVEPMLEKYIGEYSKIRKKSPAKVVESDSFIRIEELDSVVGKCLSKLWDKVYRELF
jgi:hypothetical protein